MRTFRIGTRGSPLALSQTKQLEDFLAKNAIPCSLHLIQTTGDKIQDKPLYDVGGKALFSKEIDHHLLTNAIDIAVHSLKDLETPRPKGLILAAFLKRADARDVLITSYDPLQKHAFGCGIEDLPKAAIIATSAPRRLAQLSHHRPDLILTSLRGNVETRLLKLLDKKYDGILLAKAGLDRLGITLDEQSILSEAIMVPAAGQGTIALECREDDEETYQLLRTFNDKEAEKAAALERGFIERMEGISCRSAIGIHAKFIGKEYVRIYLMIMEEDKCVYRMEDFPTANRGV